LELDVVDRADFPYHLGKRECAQQSAFAHDRWKLDPGRWSHDHKLVSMEIQPGDNHRGQSFESLIAKTMLHDPANGLKAELALGLALHKC